MANSLKHTHAQLIEFYIDLRIIFWHTSRADEKERKKQECFSIELRLSKPPSCSENANFMCLFACVHLISFSLSSLRMCDGKNDDDDDVSSGDGDGGDGGGVG